MGLFQKKIGPVFLKEESDSKEIIEKLQELSKKATGDLKNEIDKQIKIMQYGLQGEQTIAFELKNSGIDMYILHDIYLEVDGLSAQIDYVLVARRNVYILECKNLIGNIDVDNNGNFVRTYEFAGKKIKEGIYSPITQNQRHLQVIKELGLKERKNAILKALYDKFFEDFYKSLVVLANPKTYLNAKYAKKDVKEKLIRADQLIVKIKEMEAMSKNVDSSADEMREKAEAFLAVSVKNSSDYVKKYEELLVQLEMVKNISENNEEISSEEVKIEIKENTVLEVSKESGRETLIQELKKFRLEISRAEGVKPYFIFNDAQMNDLIEKMPRTKEQLLEVQGFGKVKTEKYGEYVLKILGRF